jgi:hypothetical protein
MLGRVVERMGGDGRQSTWAAPTRFPGEQEGREEAAEALMGPADSGGGGKWEEEGNAVEEGPDRQFFEVLRVDYDEGSSEDNEENGGAERGEEDEEDAGPSFETWRQVSADIQQWMAHRAKASSAQGGGMATTSAYAQDTALEEARRRLRQRAEEVRRRREQEEQPTHGGAPRGEEGDRTQILEPDTPLGHYGSQPAGGPVQPPCAARPQVA